MSDIITTLVKFTFLQKTTAHHTPLVNGELDFTQTNAIELIQGEVIEGNGDVAFEEGDPYFDINVTEGKYAGIIHGIHCTWVKTIANN